MKNASAKADRVLSIDIMRGLTLFLMLFVNDLFEKGVPKWLMHTRADVDGMGLADWVFPGFLFMVGMSIPFAIGGRLKNGEPKTRILGHILLRTFSLILIGVFMLNSDRVNSELTGLSNILWAFLLYISIFLIWNNYPKNEKLNKLFLGLKGLGIVCLVALAIIFRAGEPGNVTWFETGWWGILGLIGWGYLVAASAYLFIGPKLWATIALWVAFILLNILSQLGWLQGLNTIQPIFGVIIDGNVPSIVLAGLVVSLFLKQSTFIPSKTATAMVCFGLLSLAIGFFLRQWFIVSKIQATPSWSMICNGISMIVFVLLYVIVDIYKKEKWAAVFKPAGQNSLTTYLAPNIIYYTIWGLSLPVFFYKQETSQLLAVGGSLVWALLMVGFAALLAKGNIRLKL